MRLDPDQLDTLAAVLRLGSFEAAASELGISQPAVSLRIRSLEDRVGTPLIRRGVPCLPTQAGARLARHAEDTALLERSALQGLDVSGPETRPRVSLALNADSLATWFPPVFAAIDGIMLDIQIDDQDHSAAWLARGDVNGAITSSAKPARGCDVVHLGVMTYRATASPAFVAQHFAEGVTAETLARAPVFVFNSKDQLQSRWMIAKVGVALNPPQHSIPSTRAFVDAARQGAGWGLNPEPLVLHDISDGTLVDLDPRLGLTVPLYWQVSRRMRPALMKLEKAIVAAARMHLKNTG